MRLLKISDDGLSTASPYLVEFPPDRVPSYAILSHRWGASEDEVLFADMPQDSVGIRKSTRAKKGFIKLVYSCKQAIADGLEYLWVRLRSILANNWHDDDWITSKIDTCCIDKSSSAELSEAINSMYTWYKNADVCYAYLDDVDSALDSQNNSYYLALMQTLWVTRGWTLQELLAPRHMRFYSVNWVTLGTKASLSPLLRRMTSIDEDILSQRQPIESASIAKRMSWAARRKTTRPEDIAYCLMGIFSVNMPMLYGEGNRAFLRLQEEIMKISDDHSLFAWTDNEAADDVPHGLLAGHPLCFRHSNEFIPYGNWFASQSHYMSNRGLLIELYTHTLVDDESLLAAALNCPVPPLFENANYLMIYLKKLPNAESQYARVKTRKLGYGNALGQLRTICVRQNLITPDVEGIYPTHILRLGRFIALNREYQLPSVLVLPSNQVRARTSDQITCTILRKSGNTVYMALCVTYHGVEEFLVLLGSMAGNRIGFATVKADSVSIYDKERAVKIEQLFNPKPVDDDIAILGNHSVFVTAKVVVEANVKTYEVTIHVENVDPDSLERLIENNSPPDHQSVKSDTTSIGQIEDSGELERVPEYQREKIISPKLSKLFRGSSGRGTGEGRSSF